jgi:hypothetical protein
MNSLKKHLAIIYYKKMNHQYYIWKENKKKFAKDSPSLHYEHRPL